ncbi:MAG: hypothetical protein JOZ80_15755 [Acidobacteriaceae bacterium]|nr:hypothetical protein [Acidobacteriaceae bacterium]
MANLRRQERSAIEVVAKRFLGKWEYVSDTQGVCLITAGKRVALSLAMLKARGAGHTSLKPRLRFDKVANRVLERLQDAVGETAPDGVTVLLTITAPIRLASKTVAALEDKLQALLGRVTKTANLKAVVHGNRVHIRLLRSASQSSSIMIGFVHNADSDPFLLLNMASEMLDFACAQAAKPATRLAGERWLVVISPRTSSCLEAYRYIYSQLRMTMEFKKVLIVFGDGGVGTLTA